MSLEPIGLSQLCRHSQSYNWRVKKQTHITYEIAISGPDGLEVPTMYKAYFWGLCKGIPPQQYGLIWYSTSIFGCSNLHWHMFMAGIISSQPAIGQKCFNKTHWIPFSYEVAPQLVSKVRLQVQYLGFMEGICIAILDRDYKSPYNYLGTTSYGFPLGFS